MEQTPHILFVEDDADIRSLVADFLTQNGYRMSVAREAREVDRALEVSRIDLLILDIMLPKEELKRRVNPVGPHMLPVCPVPPTCPASFPVSRPKPL